MRLSDLEVRPYKQSEKSPWYISGLRQNGKRKRLFFPTKTEAEEELGKLKIKLRREGEKALQIPDWLRIMAMECSEELKEFPGKTIRDATTHYIKFLRASYRSCSVTELKDHFLASKKKTRRSERHQRDLRDRLGLFCEKFGDRPAATLESQEIESWLHALKLGAVSTNNYRGRIASMFAWGIKWRYLEGNPVAPIDKVKEEDGDVEIFTPDELRLVLENAPTDALPVIAIGAYAGLRTSELMQLDWSHVKIGRGHVEVKAARSKSAKRRTVKMSANLQSWLQPFQGRTGLLWTKSETAFYDAAENARMAANMEKWPHNGLRHSFASYHLAKHQNAPQLADMMGHTSTKMIYSNYREVVAPEEAERYWQILPPTKAENIVPMASGMRVS